MDQKQVFYGPLHFLGRFWRSLEFESWNLDFGFWVFEFLILGLEIKPRESRLQGSICQPPQKKANEKKEKPPKKEDKVHCLQNQVFHIFFGLSRFFLAFWEVMGNPLKGTEKKQEKHYQKEKPIKHK